MSACQQPHAHPSIHPSMLHSQPLHRAIEPCTCPPWHRPCPLQTQGDRQKPRLERPGLCQQTSRNMRAGRKRGKKEEAALRRNVEKEVGNGKTFEGRRRDSLRREMWDKIPRWKLSVAFASRILGPAELWVINAVQVAFILKANISTDGSLFLFNFRMRLLPLPYPWTRQQAALSSCFSSAPTNTHVGNNNISTHPRKDSKLNCTLKKWCNTQKPHRSDGRYGGGKAIIMQTWNVILFYFNRDETYVPISPFVTYHCGHHLEDCTVGFTYLGNSIVLVFCNWLGTRGLI